MSSSSCSSTHTLVPNASIPIGYFDEDNIQFIQQKITQVLKREYTQDILIDRASIIRVMQRVVEALNESVIMMNQRVVMEICAEFRRHQLEVDKHLKWEAHYTNSQSLFDPTTSTSKFDHQNIKLANRLGWDRVGATTRFYFT